MYPINRLSRAARRGAFASLAAFSLFSGLAPLAPSAAAQAAPYVTVDDVTVTEGSSAAFNVRVFGAHPNFSVDYRTQDVSAVAPADYTGTGGTLTRTILSSESVVQIDVPTAPDKIWEPAETFKLVLSNSSVSISDGVGVGTINDDDPVPSITIHDASVTEGDNAFVPVNMVFDVTLSNPASQDVTVDYATSNDTAVGSLGVFGGDYHTTSGTLTFPANTKPTQHVTVAVRGDLTYEKDETFKVLLSNPVNATRATTSATGTIDENDPKPHLNIASTATAVEGDGSPILMAGLIVTLSNPSTSDVTFSVNTSNGGAHAGSDYEAINNGSGTILAGQTSSRVWVQINGDTRDEDDEDFYVMIDDPVNASLGSNATCDVTITDDD
jgi:hypothetical protein